MELESTPKVSSLAFFLFPHPPFSSLMQPLLLHSYFGEVSLWTGQALLAMPTLASPIGLAMLGPYATYAALSSPILEYCLIRFISGVPMLEKGMDEKLKDDAKYKEYKKTVPCFLPIIGSLN
jgi:steroid 5-alpha reductase family enzyme